MIKRLATGIIYIGIIDGFLFLRNNHPGFFGIILYSF